MNKGASGLLFPFLSRPHLLVTQYIGIGLGVRRTEPLLGARPPPVSHTLAALVRLLLLPKISCTDALFPEPVGQLLKGRLYSVLLLCPQLESVNLLIPDFSLYTCPLMPLSIYSFTSACQALMCRYCAGC